MTIRISAIREIEDPRTETARQQPHRRDFPDPLDPRAESPLGRLRLRGIITEAEYNAGCRWRAIYLRWLRSIGAPNPFPTAIDDSLVATGVQIQPVHDPENATEWSRRTTLFTSAETELHEEIAAKTFKEWDWVLVKTGRRARDAVNAFAVYEEPEELGDFEYTSKAAKMGLAALAKAFG